jgi:hypothetical protein
MARGGLLKLHARAREIQLCTREFRAKTASFLTPDVRQVGFTAVR